MFDPKAKVKGGPLIEQMVEAKKALMAKDRARCLVGHSENLRAGEKPRALARVESVCNALS